MPDENDLRFTMELKDEFTEVFHKITDTVTDTIPKLKAGMGGLSASLAVIGGAATIGTAVYAAWTGFKNKIADVTKEAEKLEVTLGNILGSRGLAKSILQDLANSDLSKVFGIKELDEGFTTLANHGLKATLAQMKAIGDLSANTGKDFGSVIDAIVRGGEGRLETIKSLGIDVVKNKYTKTSGGLTGLNLENGFEPKGRKTKTKVDDLTLSFRGQTETIKNNSAAIQDYLLKLGLMPGVQGSMAKATDTVAGAQNNLNNQLAKVWESLAERFNPTVVDSKNKLSKWIATINEWVSIPIEKKINEEIIKIRLLQTELTNANTTESRRKDLLKELDEINPNLTKGIDAQAISYAKLAGNINDVIDALTKKITLSNLEKNYSSTISDYAAATNDVSQSKASINQAIIDAGLYDRTDLTYGQKQKQARKILIARAKKSGIDSPEFALSGILHDINSGSIDVNPGSLSDYARLGTKLNPDKKDIYSLLLLEKGIQFNNKAVGVLDKLNPDMNKMNAEKNSLSASISKTLGIDSIKDAGKNENAKTSIDKGGIASVHGGGQIRNITINIQNLVNGGVNLQTTTLKEGMSKAKDIVVEGLLTAVNDANLVGNN